MMNTQRPGGDPPVMPGRHATGSDAPELRELRVGFIPLTDCASLIVAANMGFDRRYGIRILPSREPSWAAIRDKLLGGALDAAHLLYGIAYGVQMGIAGPRRDMAVLMTLNQNGQAITLSNALSDNGVFGADALRRYVADHDRKLTFAHTFPTGTHAMWLYYWLAAYGIDPLSDVRTLTIPPPQMVTRLTMGDMDGYSAGEPWNARAVADGIGFTVATSQDIWPDHPEKVLATSREFVQCYPNTSRALIMAVLDASRYIETEAASDDIAALIARPEYIDTDVAVIADRLRGDYDNGRGRRWHDRYGMRFHGGGEVNYPYLSDAMWFMTQQRRWGLLKSDPNYYRVAAEVNQTQLYTEAAAALGIAVPDSPLRSSRLLDGRIWNGSDAAAYANGFEIAHGESVIAPS